LQARYTTTMRGLVLLSVILFAAYAAALSEKEYRNHFTAWMQKHQKSYTAEDFQNRYAIFKDNLDYVNKWNSKNSETKLDTTHLADLTNQEYRSIYLGTRFNAAERLAKAPKPLSTIKSVAALPASVDWNKAGAVTPIKNQGQCGSCWSFSTTGSTEGIHQITSGNLVSLSEQNLMDCSTAEGNNGCNGGLMDDAFEYIVKNKGLDTESSYPYQGVEGKCAFKKDNIGATIDGHTDVTAGSETDLQTAAVTQPISVAIDASHTSFQLYSSGVYYEAACSTSALDHGVLVAGYGTSGSSDYWLVKNSWGTTWGQAGYIWMSRNKNNNCGIASMASFPTITKLGINTATTNHTHTATAGSGSSGSGSSGSGSGNSGSGNSGSGNSGSGNSGSGTTYTSSLLINGHKVNGGKGFEPNAEGFKF